MYHLTKEAGLIYCFLSFANTWNIWGRWKIPTSPSILEAWIKYEHVREPIYGSTIPFEKTITLLVNRFILLVLWYYQLVMNLWLHVTGSIKFVTCCGPRVPILVYAVLSGVRFIFNTMLQLLRIIVYAKALSWLDIKSI